MQNETFEDKFSFASSDSRDGDLTSQIVISPAIDTIAVGETTHTATVADTSGNQSTFTFILNVSDGSHESGIEDLATLSRTLPEEPLMVKLETLNSTRVRFNLK